MGQVMAKLLAWILGRLFPKRMDRAVEKYQKEIEQRITNSIRKDMRH